MIRSLRRFLPVAATVFALSACEAVSPWQWGSLARPEMQLDPNVLQSTLYEQVYESKEASRGRTKTAGAGCGCN